MRNGAVNVCCIFRLSLLQCRKVNSVKWKGEGLIPHEPHRGLKASNRKRSFLLRCLFDGYGLAHGTDDGLGNDGKHFRTPDPREQIRTGFERLGLGGPIRFEGDRETNLAGIRDLDNPHGILLGSLLSYQGLTQPFQRTIGGQGFRRYLLP